MLKEMAAFLRERKDSIVRTEKISAQVPAMTEGFMTYTTIAEIEVVDFDALMEQIAAFEASFKAPPNVKVSRGAEAHDRSAAVETSARP